MKYNIRGEKVEVTPAIRSYIEDKIGKLDKYFSDASNISANVVIKVRGKEQKIDNIDIRDIELKSLRDNIAVVQIVLKNNLTSSHVYSPFSSGDTASKR